MTPAPPPRFGARLGQLGIGILHLVVLGTVATPVLPIIAGTIAAGIGGLVLVGLGVFLLIGAVYALFGVAWMETVRAESQLRASIPSLQPRRMLRPGFGGWLRALLRQSIDGSMWKAMANFGIGVLLGSLMMLDFRILGDSLSTLVLTGRTQGLLSWVGEGWGVVTAIVMVLVCLAIAVGLVALHRLISRAILVPSREAELAARAERSEERREGAVRSSEVERTRIERDLHDGVQPRLVSVGMTLGLAQQKLDSDPEAARELIDEAHTSTKAAITELRQLARGIHASVLDDRGLDAALSALVARSHVPVSLDVRLDGDCSRTTEAAVYFAIAESLTNAAKHSRASQCRVQVRRRDDGTIWARVEDDGVGGAVALPGGGIDGVTNRVIAAGGTVRLESPQGGPTSLEVTVPCAS